MLWLYDNAICDDLAQSFNTSEGNPVVKVFDPEHVLDLVAQIKEDKITFPVIALQRYDSIDIDTDRYNFSRAHLGTQAVFDKVHNTWYNEKAIPISLGYQLNIMSTNTADIDELTRELMFKYTSMYFLSIQLPYEANRRIRFGIIIDPNSSIERQSSASEYLASGQLYRTTIQLQCQGCVLVNYTPIKLRRQSYSIDSSIPPKLKDK